MRRVFFSKATIRADRTEGLLVVVYEDVLEAFSTFVLKNIYGSLFFDSVSLMTTRVGKIFFDYLFHYNENLDFVEGRGTVFPGQGRSGLN